VDTPSPAQAVAVVGDYAYVAGFSQNFGSGLQVIDVTNPASPRFAGSIFTPNRFPAGVAVVGDYAYIAWGRSGLQIVPAQCDAVAVSELDIKPGSCPNPFNRKLFEFTAGTNPRRGGVSPVAVLGSDDFDVSEIDVSTMRLEGVAPLMSGGEPKVEDVATALDDNSDCACTDEGPDGFIDLKIKFPAQEIAAAVPMGVRREQRVLTLTGVLLDGTPFEANDCVVFVGPPDGGAVLTNEEPILNLAFPNPFSPVTRISYAIPKRQSVRLVVYDVAGRLVEELADGVKGPGEQVVEWDVGRLPSGIYFYRLRADNTTLTKKMVLLK